MKLNYFDLLGKHKILLSGKVYVIPPTIGKIRELGWERYLLYRRFIGLDLNSFLEIYKLKDFHYSLPSDIQEKCTLYSYIISEKEFLDIYCGIFNFFIDGDTVFNDNNNVFNVFRGKELIGIINDSGFEHVIEALCQLNEVEYKKSSPKKFKNEKARLLYEKIEKAKSDNKFSTGGIDIPTMISKYCVVNTSGINIMNVDDMTIFQLFDQFNEYRYINAAKVQDLVYANSVSFSDLNKYNPQLWEQNKNR